MKAVAYIIPGYKDARHCRKGYDAVASFFRERGARTARVHIDWNRKGSVFENFATQFIKQYKKPKGGKAYVLGFSFGAVAALLGAPKTKPDALILCSLSPYFKEDLKTLKPQWLRWWKKDFKNSDLVFRDIVPRIGAKKTIIVVGDKEGTQVIRRAKAASRAIKNSSLVTVPNTKHNISQKTYLAAVQKIIANL